MMNTKIERVNPEQIDETIMEEAGRLIAEGELVAFPTETVYGLGGDALHPEAARKIYAAKGRPSDNPLIVHIADFSDMERVAREVPEAARKLAGAFWPGPLTMIVWKSDAVPMATTGGMDRQPVSVISTDSDVNINYARAKKNLWKNFWLISCWLNTALILFLEILTLSARHMGICSIAGMIVYTLLLLLLCIFCMIKLKKIDRSYAQKRNLTSDENDDRNWIGGILYYNPSDPHTMVEQRVGIGTTVNMATSLGKGLTIFSAIMMLSFPLLCIWLIQEEFTPIDLVIQNHTLCAQHLKTDYQIPLSEIKDPTLLTASDLPDWTRTYGTSMDTLEKGTFTISGGEDVNVFLNPENDAFLQFSANGKTYYMGGVDDTQTKGIYEELLTH